MSFKNASSAPVDPSQNALFEVGKAIYAGSDWSLHAARSRDTGASGLLRLLSAGVSSPRRKHLLSRARLFTDLHLAGFASVLATGELPDGRTYVFMDGNPDNVVCTQLGRRSFQLAEVISTANQLVKLLVAAYECGILYLDLRPDTLLWEQLPGANGEKSSQFRLRLLPADMVRFRGVASSRQITLSEESFPPPTAAIRHYQSEEQRSFGDTIDGRSTVFALGAVIHELLTGYPPAESGPVQFVAPAPVEKSDAPLQQYLTELLGRMLSRPIIQRPQPSELAEHLAWLDAMCSMISGTLLGGRYQTERLLSLGGMGAVFLARDEKFTTSNLATHVAVKVPFPQFEKARIEQEVEAVIHARKSSPDIVEIIDRGSIPDVGPYIVMRYLEGETLEQRLLRRGDFPTDEALLIGQYLSRSLEAIHRKDIVHRDIKPANVMIVADPSARSGERYMLLDFGIARVGAPDATSVRRLTSVGMRMGTPNYMPPEQIADAAMAGPPADVYALGALMYELIGGQLPAIPPLRWRGSPALMRLLTRMLDVFPAKRPSMHDVHQRLGQIYKRRVALRVAAAALLGSTVVAGTAWMLRPALWTAAPQQPQLTVAASQSGGALNPPSSLSPAAPLTAADRAAAASPAPSPEVTTPATDRTPLLVPVAPEAARPALASAATVAEKTPTTSPIAPRPAGTVPVVNCREDERRPLSLACFQQAGWSDTQRTLFAKIVNDLVSTWPSGTKLCPGERIEIARLQIGALTGVKQDRRAWLKEMISMLRNRVVDQPLPIIIECK